MQYDPNTPIWLQGLSDRIWQVEAWQYDRLAVDAVIDFTGNERVINQIVEATRIAGKIVHVGMVEKPLTYRNFMYGVVYKELVVTGIFGRRLFETWTLVMNLLKTGKIDLNSFIAGEMKLEEFEKANEEFPKYSGRIILK